MKYLLLPISLALGCAPVTGGLGTGNTESDGTDGTDGTSDSMSGSSSASDSASASGTSGSPTSATASASDSGGTGGTGSPGCVPPAHSPCDSLDPRPTEAIGLNCPGELAVTNPDGAPVNPEAIGTRTAFGADGTYDPREGSAYAVLGSGLVEDLDDETPTSDTDNNSVTFCSDNLGDGYNPMLALPPPLDTMPASDNCANNPDAIGSGDCSDTLQAAFEGSTGAFDYTELRTELVVPDGVTSFTVDFAFLSTEYPWFLATTFNDMVVIWVDSERWTGNIAFSGGDPISAESGLVTVTDDSGNLPAVDGSCMRYHGGTPWLTSTAPVQEGETAQIIFAVFDMSDSIVDSYAFIDNFQWACHEGDTPTTVVAG
jgi:hypothetical protein